MTDITEAQKKELLKIPEFKLIRQQYMKEQKMAGAGKRRMKGKGSFWEDVGNWFYNAGQSVNNFLKSTKLISNVAGAVLPILAPMATALLTLNPLASAASVGAAKATAEGIKALGYGSKMRGMGNDPLAINPPDQRMRGIAPKSTMRGAGRRMGGKGTMQEDAQAIARAIVGRGEYTTADIDGVKTLSLLQNRKMRSISGQGYGTNFNTMGVNGIPQVSVAPAHSGMIHNIGGKGMMKTRRPRNRGMGGTEFGVVSSDFGNVKF
jgi:hypothetical protein